MIKMAFDAVAVHFKRRHRAVDSASSGMAKSCGFHRLGAEFGAGTTNRSAKPKGKAASL